jgi:hypothetical protein
VVRPGHDVPAASGRLGQGAGVLRAHAPVHVPADVGDGFQGHGAGVAPDVQKAVGRAQAAAVEEKDRPEQGRRAPGPLEQVRRDILEHGARHASGPRQDGMGPVAAGADSPDMDGKVPGPLPQEFEAGLHVAVEEAAGRSAPAETGKVEGQDMVPGGAEGLDPSPQVEVGLSPDDPGMKQEDGAARASRREPGGGERAAAVPPRHSEALERRQLLRRVRLGCPRQPRREGQKKPHRQSFPPGPRPGCYRPLRHRSSSHSSAHMDISRGERPRRYGWGDNPPARIFKQQWCSFKSTQLLGPARRLPIMQEAGRIGG